jgi:hypothetical protein
VALMNLPFVRSRTKKNPLRSALAPAWTVLPSLVSSNGMNSLVPSKSQPSCGVPWKCHLISPSSGSIARVEEL